MHTKKGGRKKKEKQKSICGHALEKMPSNFHSNNKHWAKIQHQSDTLSSTGCSLVAVALKYVQQFYKKIKVKLKNKTCAA